MTNLELRRGQADALRNCLPLFESRFPNNMAVRNRLAYLRYESATQEELENSAKDCWDAAEMARKKWKAARARGASESTLMQMQLATAVASYAANNLESAAETAKSFADMYAPKSEVAA